MNYTPILDQIVEIANKCGRDPTEITLVAVTKEVALEKALKAYETGCRDFGENRVQDALPKIAEAPEDINWHFIGTLQKNKVRKVVGKFVLIHSVDTFELAEKISQVSQEEGITTSILLEVNTSGETTKHGFTPKTLPIDQLKALPNLDIQGLMTMAPYTEDEAVIRNCFSNLRNLRDTLNLKHLSMGMTNDYPIAIEEGATLLRIGTAIFMDPKNET